MKVVPHTLVANTPTEEDITLPAIDTYEGTNTISFSNDPAPSSMYSRYYGE